MKTLNILYSEWGIQTNGDLKEELTFDWIESVIKLFEVCWQHCYVISMVN